MIKVFTVDKEGKISFTKKELEDLLNEAYWEGYSKNLNTTTISYPYHPYTPYYTWTNGTLTINSNESYSDSGALNCTNTNGDKNKNEKNY